MRIITWNVNRFDGISDWYSERKDLSLVRRKEFANKIIEKLKELLSTSKDIAILQEVPYKNDECKNDEWESIWREMFKDFKIMFWFKDEPKREDFYYDSLNITLAIAKSDSEWTIRPFDKSTVKFGQDVKYTRKYWNYVNRYIILDNENRKLSLLGIHVKLKDRESILEEISKQEFSFIVGDFNYNALLNNKDKKHYEKIKEKHNQIIPDDIITHNQDVSGIDKILVKKNLENKETRIEVRDYCFVSGDEQKNRVSDHNICLCDISI